MRQIFLLVVVVVVVVEATLGIQIFTECGPVDFIIIIIIIIILFFTQELYWLAWIVI